MRTNTSLLLLLAFSTLLGSCTSTAKLAEAAYARGDWTTAAKQYEAALTSAASTDDIARIRSRLDECRQKASHALFAEARSHEAAGDRESAWSCAAEAFKFQASPELGAFLRRAREQLAAQLLQSGKAAADHRRWQDAERLVGRAQDLYPTEKGAETLAKVRNALEEANRVVVHRFTTSGAAALEQRDWTNAAANYAKASELSKAADIRKKADFAKAMARAEQMFAERPRALSRCHELAARYEHALSFGIDTEHVRRRMLATRPATYRITINGCVTLPFKPVAKTAWDGPGGHVVGSDALLATLGDIMGDSEPTTALTSAVLKIASAGMRAPDCYPVISALGQTQSYRTLADQDDYQPSWDITLTLPNTHAFDDRVLGIRVMDRDLENDDTVGSHGIRIGDLITQAGRRTHPLVDKSGALSAGALLSITITTERL